jgi:hypothetical protein
VKLKKIVFIFLALLIISACGKNKSIDINSILENKGQISSLQIHEDGKTINLNEQPITEKDKIDKFQRIVGNLKFVHIDTDVYKEVLEKIYQDSKGKSLSVMVQTENVAKDETSLNGLTYNFLEDGTVIIADIKNNKGEKFYKISNKDSSLYSEVETYYKENVETIIIDNVLDQLEDLDDENK